MKNKKMKRFSIFTAGLLALSLMAQGFVTIISDVTHIVVHAIEGNVVYFAQSSVDATDNSLIYVDLVAKGAVGDVIEVSYKTFSGTAIQDIDYKAVDNKATLKIAKNATEATYKIAIKCLNDIDTREKLRIYSGDNSTYGRYFNLKITDASNATIDPNKNTCKCYLTYNSRVEATIDAPNDQTLGSKISYINDYKTMEMAYEGGAQVDGGSTRKSWQHGVTLNNETTRRWLNTYITPGFANAYGTILVKNIDDSTGSKWTVGQGKLSVLFGNKEFIEKYTRSSSCPGLYMYAKINPPGEKITGKAMHLMSQWKNPYDDDDDLVDAEIYKIAEDHKQIYWFLDRETWFGNVGNIYDSEFYKVEPYNNVLDLGAAGYNHNDEADMIYKNIWLAMTLYDDKAPTITAQYSEYNTENGALRIYLRFSEPVYTSKKGDLTVKFNGYNTEFSADYIEGNYSDTLVYEVAKADVPKIKITSVKYELPGNDISDLAYKLDSYKIVNNNKVENTDQQREAKIISGIIDLNQPKLNVDLASSGGQYRNIYNIVLSANDNGNREFNDGTIYYSWSHESTIENPNSPLSYNNSHVLTSEEDGSFAVSLSKNQSLGIDSGIYYLHALAVSKYGFKHSATFGAYLLDGDAPDIQGVTFHQNVLKTKQIDLTIIQKDIKNLTMYMKYEGELGSEITLKRTLISNGVEDPDVANILDRLEDETTYTYRFKSNIDDTVGTIPLDTFILELMGEKPRFDADFYFVIEDMAGNRATSDTHHLTYDTRDLFTPDVAIPASYVPVSDIVVNTDVYDISAASVDEGITISTSDPTLTGYIDDGATFSVVINGKTTKVAEGGDNYSVTLKGLPAGHYDFVAAITGGTGNVNIASRTISYYLTNGKQDNTANKEKIEGNLVLSNKVFQLEDSRFYYFNTSKSSVETHNYGATYEGGKYVGGSSAPTFSSNIEAKKYIKYMEYQDLYLISISDTIASLLNSGTGSTVYVKAPGEVKNAQAGQLWIRYKKNIWTDVTGASGWAFYFYGDGNVEDGINISSLSANLNAAIDAVTNRIVSEGHDKYLVTEDDVKQTTGEPYLAAGQIHVKVESVTETKGGTPFVSEPTYGGDPNLYQNTVTIDDKTYPIATNMPLSVDGTTSLYFKEAGAGDWHPLAAKDGQLIKDVLKNQATGIYTIREYAKGGVSEFSFYLDRSLPVLNVVKDEGLDSEVNLNLDGSDVTSLTCKSLTLKTLDNEADPQAYVAIYSYPNKSLQKVLYADEILDYSLSGGNFYLQVGDRSGNVATYTVLTSDSQIELSVDENESKTGIIVRVNNRSDSEIYSYEVYLNETLIDTEFAATKFYRESGIYRVEVTDIYGNKETRIISHESPTPNITWYYLNDNESYSVYDPLRPTRMILEEDMTSPRTTNVYASTLVRLRFDTSYGNGNIKFELLGIQEKDYTYNESTGLLSINSLSGWRLRVWYEDQPNVDHTYIFHLDNNPPEVTATFVGTSFHQHVEYDDYGNVILTSTFDAINTDNYEVGQYVTLDNLQYEMDGTSTISFDNNGVIAGSHIVIQVNDPTGIRSFSITRNGQPLEMELNVDNKLLLNSPGYYVLTFTDNLGNMSVFSFTNVEGTIADGFVDAELIEQDVMSYGHDEMIIKTLYNGNNTFIITHDDKSETYVFSSDGKNVTVG